MFRQHHLKILSLCVILSSLRCGDSSSSQSGKNTSVRQNQADSDGQRTNASDSKATEVAKKAPLKKEKDIGKKPVEDEKQPLDPSYCPNVSAHGDHSHCDEEDVKTSDKQETPVQTPPSSNQPNQPAPPPAQTPPPAPNTPPPPANPPPKADPNIVEFRIKSGTGTQPWNTQQTMVQAKVGQTIRIINEDTVDHRLHTGGAPCPHGPNIPPGGTFDCVARNPLNATQNPGQTYDHIAGRNAVFYLNVAP